MGSVSMTGMTAIFRITGSPAGALPVGDTHALSKMPSRVNKIRKRFILGVSPWFCGGDLAGRPYFIRFLVPIDRKRSRNALISGADVSKSGWPV
jgi:hypothetical protein